MVWSLLFIAYCLTYAIEYGVPFFKRMTSVAMMVYLFMGTFGLSEANLVDQGTYVPEPKTLFLACSPPGPYLIKTHRVVQDSASSFERF